VVRLEPASLFFAFDNCADAPVLDTRVQIDGPAGFGYSLSLEGAPAWAAVIPEAGLFPESVTLFVDPASLASGIGETALVVTFDLANATGLVERVPIVLTCNAQTLYLPGLIVGNP
jgi:hypothetical protein